MRQAVTMRMPARAARGMWRAKGAKANMVTATATAEKTPDHWEWSLPSHPEGDGSGGPNQDAQPPEGEHLEHLEHFQEKY